MKRQIAGMAALLAVWVSTAFVPTLLDRMRIPSVMNAQTNKDDNRPGEFDSELAAAGEDIFERTAGGTGCAACHGHYALGDLGDAPNLRGSDEARIRGGLEAIAEMEQLASQISDDDITALAEYLQFLNTLVPGKFTRLRGGNFNATEIRFPTNVAAQFIVENRDRRVCTFEADLEGFETVKLGRMDHASFRWRTPEKPATFEAGCQESPETRLMITVEESSEGKDR